MRARDSPVFFEDVMVVDNPTDTPKVDEEKPVEAKDESQKTDGQKPTASKKYQLTAINWAENFVLKELVRKIGQKPIHQSGRELVFEYGESRYLFIYSFGVVAFFNMTVNQRAKIINLLEVTEGFNLARRIEDTYIIEVKPGAKEEMGYDKITWQMLEFGKLRMVAKILSESVALEYTENLSSEILQHTHRYTKQLEVSGRLPYRTRELVKYIGFATTTREHVMANFYVIDKPEETWDDIALERLYLSLKEMFDIDVRYRALEQKLHAIHDSVEVIVDLVRSRRDMMLELLIIALIAFEVVLWFIGQK